MAWWNNEPWRLIQTNLREVDFATLNPNTYAQTLADLGATVVLLNSAGISANYESKIEFQQINPYVANPTILHTLLEELHKRNIRVLARTDFSKIPLSVGKTHPHWLYRTATGKTMEYNGFVSVCINGEYQQTQALVILEELFTEFPFDGLYCNMSGFQTRDYSHREYGFCHCQACVTAFYMYAQAPIPVAIDLQDPLYHAYLAFQEEVVDAWRKKINQFIKQIPNRELCFDGIDYDRRESASETIHTPIDFIYHSSSNSRTAHPERIMSNSDVDFIGFTHRRISVPPALHTLRLIQSLAHGGNLDYYLIGALESQVDRTGLKRVKKVFDLHKKNRPLFDGTVARPSVLLRRNDGWVISEEEKGWIILLTELHITFTEATKEKLLVLDLHSFDALILGDSVNLSLEEAKKIDAYANDGGKVVATGRSGFYDAAGPRTTPLLTSLNMNTISSELNSANSALFMLRSNDRLLFPSLQETDVVPAGDYVLSVDPKSTSEQYLAYVPPHPYGPPERCYFSESTLRGGIFRYNSVYYLPWFFGSFLYRTGQHSLRLLGKDLLISSLGLRSVALHIPSCIEVSIRYTVDGRQVVYLINSSGFHGTQIGDPIVVGPVELIFDSAKKPKKLFTLSGQEVTSSLIENSLIIRVEQVREYEMIVIEYNKE